MALTTAKNGFLRFRAMANSAALHRDNAQRRIHFIAEWIDRRGLSQADVVEALGVNKGTVSKWCSGALPSEKLLIMLADFLRVEIPSLFRHPDDDRVSRIFERRTDEELTRMVDTLRAAFPRDEPEYHPSNLSTPSIGSEKLKKRKI